MAILMPPPKPAHPGYLNGATYPLITAPITAPAAVAAADTLYLLPFVARRSQPLLKLGARVTAAGTSASFKAAIWAAHPSTMRPTGRPIASNNTGKAISGLGAVMADLAGPAALVQGSLYFSGLLFTFSAAPTVLLFAGSTPAITDLLGIDVGQSTTTQVTGLSAAQSYSADIAALDLTSASFTNLTGAQAVHLAGF